MVKVLIVGVGGFLGAIARYGLSGWIQKRSQATFPYGTLTVNVIGCFVIGCLMYLVESRPALSPYTRLFIGIGILGAFTTFSSFGYETLQLMRAGSYRLALGNVGANFLLGLTAVWLGRVATQAARL